MTGDPHGAVPDTMAQTQRALKLLGDIIAAMPGDATVSDDSAVAVGTHVFTRPLLQALSKGLQADRDALAATLQTVRVERGQLQSDLDLVRIDLAQAEDMMREKAATLAQVRQIVAEMKERASPNSFSGETALRWAARLTTALEPSKDNGHEEKDLARTGE